MLSSIEPFIHDVIMANGPYPPHCRLCYPRFYRCPCALGWCRNTIPSAKLGTGDIPCLWNHYIAQVRTHLFCTLSPLTDCHSHSSPSSHNVDGFVERSRVESGQLIGPRIFHTGQIIYGAGAPEYHQDIHDMDEAYSALVRIKVEGGPASFSYKNYNLPSRYVIKCYLRVASGIC